MQNALPASAIMDANRALGPAMGAETSEPPQLHHDEQDRHDPAAFVDPISPLPIAGFQR
jgi:hypothetical protein